MRQERNNEIDLLLRRMSRRAGGSMRDGEVQTNEQHLDADELSSYAQNALPVATRARYTEHLAECSRCRKLVTELSLSLGASTAVEASTTPQPSALRKFLASLFSPMVLRYAVPALGVIVLAVVGVVVLRQQQGKSDFVAQVEPKRSEPAAAVQTPAATPTPAAGLQSNSNLQTETQARDERTAKEGEVAESKAPAATGAAAPPHAEKDQKAADTEASAEQRPVVAATPPSAAVAPKVASTGTETAKIAETEAQKKKEDIPRKQPEAVAQTAKEPEVSTERAREPVRDNRRTAATAANRNEPSANKSLPLAAGVSDAGGRMAPQKRAKADKDIEIRTVAGRHFRKERGVWIDTAYDESKETTNVTRGSEQFRALVADEPGIRTIAQQLDGEVIVVWKGRAYRIR